MWQRMRHLFLINLALNSLYTVMLSGLSMWCIHTIVRVCQFDIMHSILTWRELQLHSNGGI